MKFIAVIAFEIILVLSSAKSSIVAQNQISSQKDDVTVPFDQLAIPSEENSNIVPKAEEAKLVKISQKETSVETPKKTLPIEKELFERPPIKQKTRAKFKRPSTIPPPTTINPKDIVTKSSAIQAPRSPLSYFVSRSKAVVGPKVTVSQPLYSLASLDPPGYNRTEKSKPNGIRTVSNYTKVVKSGPTDHEFATEPVHIPLDSNDEDFFLSKTTGENLDIDFSSLPPSFRPKPKTETLPVLPPTTPTSSVGQTPSTVGIQHRFQLSNPYSPASNPLSPFQGTSSNSGIFPGLSTNPYLGLLGGFGGFSPGTPSNPSFGQGLQSGFPILDLSSLLSGGFGGQSLGGFGSSSSTAVNPFLSALGSLGGGLPQFQAGIPANPRFPGIPQAPSASSLRTPVTKSTAPPISAATQEGT